MKRTKRLSEQVEEKVKNSSSKDPGDVYDGDPTKIISTGSTLLDLAISGGRFREGGIPAGIFVEIFGPPSAGKTVLLCQIAANVQRAGGSVLFHDPEARLNRQFARLFGLNTDEIQYTISDTIAQVFSSVREWQPDGPGPHAVIADSLAALSTEMEMDDGDKMGMRRAKEFSEELRKTCRVITQRGLLMVASNQVRQNLDAGPYGQRYKSPGGEAIGFYASLRLRCMPPEKIKVKRSVRGREQERVIGVKTEIEVFKSSVWKPYRRAEVYILYDYGIDDIRGNLEFLKSIYGTYELGGRSLGKNISAAIRTVEDEGLEKELKEEVIDLWHEIEEKFSDSRKPRV